MKLISVFNNKGGVGKTTLTFHLAHALALLGKKTLLIDLDPQCNLTILGMPEERIHDIWGGEDEYIDDFKAKRDQTSPGDFDNFSTATRTIHFLLKPTEDGVTDVEALSTPHRLAANLDLIPGRLSMHLYEEKISGRWSDVYQGDPLAIRTITRIRQVAVQYASKFGYDYVIIDTSPSLGTLNKVIISTVDGFLIPCMPDLFSVYGIRNIGNALGIWQKQFQTIYHLLSEEKRKAFPSEFVRLLGYTIFNAKKYANDKNPWDLAAGHYHYAQEIPTSISKYIPEKILGAFSQEEMTRPIGGTSVMHTHNTLPAMAQKYHKPMWSLPDAALNTEDAMTVKGNRKTYEDTRAKYRAFATDLLSRLEHLG
jgi:cellulose biosynthesis protein BcsQ